MGSSRPFSHNRSVTDVSNTTVITNVYNKTVINRNVSNISVNGGPNGTKATPTPQELQAANRPHTPPTKDQVDHKRLASENKELHASVNKGRPPIAAVSKAGDFKHPFAAKGAPGLVKPASLRGPAGAKPMNAIHQPLNGVHGNNAIVHGANNPTPGWQHNANHRSPPHATAALGGGPAHGPRNPQLKVAPPKIAPKVARRAPPPPQNKKPNH